MQTSVLKLNQTILFADDVQYDLRFFSDRLSQLSLLESTLTINSTSTKLDQFDCFQGR